MPGGFRVDLNALQQAAQGVNDTLRDIQRRSVSDLGQSAASFGHGRLSETVGDFCDRWELGVQHLSTDVQEVAGRLSDCVEVYRQVDETAQEHLSGILQRATGDDPAAE